MLIPVIYVAAFTMMAEISSCNRDHIRLQSLKYLQSGPLQKKVCQILRSCLHFLKEHYSLETFANNSINLKFYCLWIFPIVSFSWQNVPTLVSTMTML